jgi:hypothetical protein
MKIRMRWLGGHLPYKDEFLLQLAIRISLGANLPVEMKQLFKLLVL